MNRVAHPVSEWADISLRHGGDATVRALEHLYRQQQPQGPTECDVVVWAKEASFHPESDGLQGDSGG